MKMIKRRIVTIALLAALVAAFAVFFAGCGSAVVTDFTMDAEGKFSFTGFGSAERYIVEVYNSADVKDEDVADDASYVARITLPAGKNTIKGEISDVKTLPWGKYTALAYGVVADGDGSSRTDPASAEFSRSGTLTAPTVAYSWRGFELTATIGTDSLTAYQDSEALTTFTTEVYSDSACTTKVGSIEISTPVLTVGGGMGPGSSSTWTGNSDTFTYNGTIGTDVTLYVRTRANASDDGMAKESEWTKAESFVVNGFVAESGLAESYYTGSDVSEAKTYSRSGFNFEVVTQSFMGSTTTKYTDCTATLAMTAEGGFTYTLSGKAENAEEASTITTLTGTAKADGRQYWFKYTKQQSGGGFPGFPGFPGGGSSTVTQCAGAFLSADGNTMTVNFGDGTFELTLNA